MMTQLSLAPTITLIVLLLHKFRHISSFSTPNTNTVIRHQTSIPNTNAYHYRYRRIITPSSRRITTAAIARSSSERNANTNRNNRDFFVDTSEARYESPQRRAAFQKLSMATLLSSLLEPVFGGAVSAATEEDNEIPECRNGAILPEYEVPGAYQNKCMSQPYRTITLPSSSSSSSAATTTISIEQNLPSQTILTGQTGMSVWNSALLLTRVMSTLSFTSNDGNNPLKGKTVMELGCGAGLASIAAAKLGAARVVATDGNGDVLELTRRNVRRNGASETVAVEEMKWGLLNAADYYDEVDVVVGSDLTYNSANWKALAETVAAVLKRRGVFLYVAGGHSGSNLEGEVDGFRVVAETEGLKVVPPGDGIWDGLLERSLRDKAEREVVRKAGGAKVLVLMRV